MYTWWPLPLWVPLIRRANASMSCAQASTSRDYPESEQSPWVRARGLYSSYDFKGCILANDSMLCAQASTSTDLPEEPRVNIPPGSLSRSAATCFLLFTIPGVYILYKPLGETLHTLLLDPTAYWGYILAMCKTRGTLPGVYISPDMMNIHPWRYEKYTPLHTISCCSINLWPQSAYWG